MANYKELKDVCVKITDGSHFSPKTVPEGYPYITVRDIEGDKIDFERCKFIGEKSYLELERNGCRPLNGDVLFSKDGTVGKVSLIDYEKKFVVLSSLAIIRPNPEIVGAAYLKHQLTTPEVLKKATGRKTGAAIRRIVLKNLKTIPIPVPPIAEQERIVGILDEAFEGIAAATAQAEKNLHNARELFQSVLQSTFSQKGDDWVETTLEEVCGFQNGFAFKSAKFRESGMPILRISNIQDDQIDTRKIVFTDPSDYREDLDRYRVVKDDLLIAMSGATTGKIGFNTTDTIFLLNQRVGKFEPSGSLEKRFLYFYLLTKVEENLRISAGAAQPNLSTEQIKGFQIPLPQVPQQQAIVGKLDALSEESKRLEAIYERKKAALDELKQSLLQKAFAGEL